MKSKLSVAARIFFIVLMSNNVHAISQKSKPLYTQTIKFENVKMWKNSYFYFESVGVSYCENCQDVTVKPKYMTINFPLPRYTMKGALFVSKLQLRQDVGQNDRSGNNNDPIVCEYELNYDAGYIIPFTIQPTGDFVLEERSYSSRLTMSNSVICDMVNSPAIAVKKDNDDYVFQFTDFPMNKA